jgi:hypothetical protein
MSKPTLTVFDPRGHIIIYGPTMCGKTLYAQYVINKIKVKKTYVFTRTPRDWPQTSTRVLCDGNFEEEVTKMYEECESYMDEKYKEDPQYAQCPFAVVFDDYATVINMTSNKAFIDLWTRGRHAGMRIISLAHQFSSIGPSIRANSAYVCISCTAIDEEIKLLAETFFRTCPSKLSYMCKLALQTNKYIMVVIHNKTDLSVDKAPAPASQIIEHKVPMCLEGLNPDPAYREIPRMEPYTNTSAASLSSPMTFGCKSAHNMFDGSVNNFQVNNSMQNTQLLENNDIHNKIKLANYYAERKLELTKLRDQFREMVYMPYRSTEDKLKMLYTLNTMLRPNPKYSLDNMDSGVEQFMQYYFPADQYKTPHYKKGDISSLVTASSAVLMTSNSPFASLIEAYKILNQ